MIFSLFSCDGMLNDELIILVLANLPKTNVGTFKKKKFTFGQYLDSIFNLVLKTHVGCEYIVVIRETEALKFTNSETNIYTLGGC